MNLSESLMYLVLLLEEEASTEYRIVPPGEYKQKYSNPVKTEKVFYNIGWLKNNYKWYNSRGFNVTPKEFDFIVSMIEKIFSYAKKCFTANDIKEGHLRISNFRVWKNTSEYTKKEYGSSVYLSFEINYEPFFKGLEILKARFSEHKSVRPEGNMYTFYYKIPDNDSSVKTVEDVNRKNKFNLRIMRDIMDRMSRKGSEVFEKRAEFFNEQKKKFKNYVYSFTSKKYEKDPKFHPHEVEFYERMTDGFVKKEYERLYAKFGGEIVVKGKIVEASEEFDLDCYIKFIEEEIRTYKT